MRVLITGVTGQDGSYLAEHLIDTGDDVWGMVRNPGRLGWAQPLVGQMHLTVGDLLSQESLEEVIKIVAPDEVYNLAAVTAPGAGWGAPQPPLLADTTGLGVLHLCEAIRLRAPDATLVHASSSAVHQPHRYGLYGVAKQFAHDTVVGYRDGYKLRAYNAVLYSHTSPRQDTRFLARRITAAVADVAAGRAHQVVLGNLDSRRDWGYTPDYVRAMVAIARGGLKPGAYVVATGRRHSVRDFVEAALAAVGLSMDVVYTVGGPEWNELPVRERLQSGWTPSVTFETMIKLMMEAEA